MQSTDLLIDVLRYGMAFSALMVSLVLWGYGRGGLGRGYGLMSLAMMLVAARYALLLLAPANAPVHWFIEIEPVVRALLLVTGLQYFSGHVSSAKLSWLTVSGMMLWLVVAPHIDISESFRAYPGALMLVVAYLACARHFWRSRDLSRPVGFISAAVCFLALAGLWVVAPWWRMDVVGVWAFATAQVLYVMLSASLILALYQSEKLRADFVSLVHERALMRVLRSRERMVQMREWTDVLLKQISDGVVVTDMNGTITGFNRAAERIYGYHSSDVLGKSVIMLLMEEDRPGEQEQKDALEDYAKRFHQPGDIVGRHQSGERLELELVVSVMEMSDARQVVAIVRDNSERRRQQSQLEFMASHDALTRLPNRSSFERLVGARREQPETGVLAFVDLDDFKLINDTLGHKAGDTALLAMSRRLTNAAGKEAVVARQSGDEFVIYVPHMSDIRVVRKWVEELVVHVRNPVSFDDVEFGLSCSVGLTLCDDQTLTVEELIRQADLAMYHAKRSGKNRHSFYHPGMLEESQRTADLASRLRRMDLDQELHLVFQPRMQVEGRQLSGAEVLLRWRSTTGENVSPDDFIPVAEETGQILRIGYWVLEQACRHLAQWGHLRDGLVLSINLSARQLFDEELLERIEEVRNYYGLAPAQLEFEITESSAMQDIDYALRVLGRLRALGYGLSLDDFGTGFSSLSHLRSLPVDTVKIDRCFIEEICSNAQDRVMVSGIIELAGHLDMRVLAEGVEQGEQLDLLEALGCGEAQGYHIGRPMMAQEFVQLLGEWEQLRVAL